MPNPAPPAAAKQAEKLTRKLNQRLCNAANCFSASLSVTLGEVDRSGLSLCFTPALFLLVGGSAAAQNANDFVSQRRQVLLNTNQTR